MYIHIFKDLHGSEFGLNIKLFAYSIITVLMVHVKLSFIKLGILKL